MPQAVIELLNHVTTGPQSPLLGPINRKYDSSTINAMAFSVVEWLKYRFNAPQARKTVPLELEVKYPWCRALEEVARDVPEFSELFCVVDWRLDFHPSVPVEERKEIEKYADERYKPRMMDG